MKNLIALAVLSTLIGCSTVNNPTQSSYTETQTDVATGVTLLPSDKMWVDFPEVVNIYKETMQCLGLYADGPDVQFINTTEVWAAGYNAWGYYHPGGLVTVNTNEQDIYAGFPERNKDIDTQVLKHEYIHHVLHENDLPWHDGYSAELFARCGQGVNVNN